MLIDWLRSLHVRRALRKTTRNVLEQIALRWRAKSRSQLNIEVCLSDGFTRVRHTKGMRAHRPVIDLKVARRLRRVTNLELACRHRTLVVHLEVAARV